MANLHIDPSGEPDGCDLCAENLNTGLLPACVEMCPSGARISGDLDDPKSELSKLIVSGKAKPLLLAGVKHTSVYYIPSPSEPTWDELGTSEDFLEALARRKRDLPPVRGVV